jgi:hypothetical protein
MLTLKDLPRESILFHFLFHSLFCLLTEPTFSEILMDPIGMEYPDFLGYDANLPATCDSMEVENTIFTSVDSRIPISSAGHELNSMQLSR